MRGTSERLQDIIDAAGNIQRYVVRGQQVFLEDELVRTWIIHQLGVIGEAASNLPDTLRKAHPDIPWAKIIGMRNQVVHNYFGISLKIV